MSSGTWWAWLPGQSSSLSKHIEHGYTEKDKRPETHVIAGTPCQYAGQGFVPKGLGNEGHDGEEPGDEHKAGASGPDQPDSTFKDFGQWTAETKIKAQ